VLLWVWVERRIVGKLTSFLRKGSSKNCIIVKIDFFSFPTSILLLKQDRSFPFLSDNVYFKCVLICSVQILPRKPKNLTLSRLLWFRYCCHRIVIYLGCSSVSNCRNQSIYTSPRTGQLNPNKLSNIVSYISMKH